VTHTPVAEPGDDARGGTTPDLVAFLNTHHGELVERMGIVFTEAGADRVVATMPVEGNRQPYGLLHGGASVVLAESVASMAAAILAGPGAIAVGIEINATHHRSATSGIVTAVATRIHSGRTLATYDIRIADEEGRPVCTCRLTCLLRPETRADGTSTVPDQPTL
jgi:uncharacterized protein (TIGR00369 family)